MSQLYPTVGILLVVQMGRMPIGHAKYQIVRRFGRAFGQNYLVHFEPYSVKHARNWPSRLAFPAFCRIEWSEWTKNVFKMLKIVA